MQMDPKNLVGSLKAAILVHALGWDVVAPVMDQLSQSEQNLVFRLQSKLGDLSPALVEGVAREFLEKARSPEQIENNKGPDKKGDTDPDALNKGLQAIRSVPSDVLMPYIQNEHPQTISLIIAHLEPNSASEVMSLLPDEVKTDVAYRIANLDKVSSGMLEEIDSVFKEILSKESASTIEKAGGVQRLAEILNMIDGATTEQIIEDIEEEDPDLAEEIRQNMFVFDDILLVDDRGLQKVLRSVESQELAIALKASTEGVKEKVFRNMSDRAAAILKEEMDVSGAVRIKEVTDAQQKITKVVQDMERKGELIVSGRGGEELIG